MSRAFLGLGSNVGDRLANLSAAVRLLREHPAVEVTRVSAVYETEAMEDAAGQRDFYNAVVEAETDLEPRDLLAACKDVERELGREPGGPRHAPRPIDVDLLLLGDLVFDEDGLTIPHPGIADRRFVLVPLLELAPDLPFDASGSALEGQRVTPVGALQQ